MQKISSFLQHLLGSNLPLPAVAPPPIRIVSSNIPGFNTREYLAIQVDNTPVDLLCCEGTRVTLSPVNTLVTGESDAKNEVLWRQIVCAIKNNCIPIVLSQTGPSGQVMGLLRGIYRAEGICTISPQKSPYVPNYAPFGDGISADLMDEVILSLLQSHSQGGLNTILWRNYIAVCREVFSRDRIAREALDEGTIRHIDVLDAVNRLNISDTQKTRLNEIAENSVSVSVDVISLFHVFMKKFSVFPLETTETGTTDVIRTRGLVIRPLVQSRIENTFSMDDASQGKCIFCNLSRDWNELELSMLVKTLEIEMANRPSLQNRKLVFIFENVKSGILSQFEWIESVFPTAAALFVYNDYFSALEDDSAVRQRFQSKFKRIIFFHTTNEESLKWMMEFLGHRRVSYNVYTKMPINDVWDWIFPKYSQSEQHEERYWCPLNEGRELYNRGIIYDKDLRCKPCYLENGQSYLDRDYNGRVNFGAFSFR